ncbi:MAG TPA: hypothetical protein VMB25_14830 [Bryobacteraceae bacterium]|nr:hypothetical protein [Bryobacteraceae bacterium]
MHGALRDLIRRGRARQLSHWLIHAASFAAVVALGGAILLLLLGTQILNWYWLVLLFAVSLGAAIYRSRHLLLSRYQVAQSIDRRLGLQDALSTAWYFEERPDKAVSPPAVVAQQRETAEEMARAADVRRGVPFLLPKTVYVNLALVAVALGMFGLRYGLTRSLDLRSSLVHIDFDGFLGNTREIADAKNNRGPRALDPNDKRDPSASADPADPQPENLDSTPDAELNPAEDPGANNSNNSGDKAQKPEAKGNEPLPPGNDPLDSGGKGQSSPQADSNSQNSSPGANAQSGRQQAGSKDGSQKQGTGENSSLADKVRDALANLMAKLKPQSGQGSKQNNSSQSAGQQSARQQNQTQDGQPKPTPGQEPNDASSDAQSQGEQQQGASEQASQAKSEARSNNQPNSPEGKSGIGKQDGDKTAREAAELAAMGKISEIIGKRSANVTGEVMVEVSSGKQQLKTQYSQRDAAHSDQGGEINRDEIPLAYQQYVQQYFAEIRKLPAAKAKPEPAKPKGASN